VNPVPDSLLFFLVVSGIEPWSLKTNTEEKLVASI
jgi:hypothetical protein